MNDEYLIIFSFVTVFGFLLGSVSKSRGGLVIGAA
jgi:hypothetical protein